MLAWARSPGAIAPSSPITFDSVYANHANFVFRSLRRLGVPRADVPDATQQAFLVVFRRWDSFDGSSALTTWLFGICLRVAADFKAKAHVHREVVSATVPEGVSLPTQSEVVQESQTRAWLERLLDVLDDDKRAVFVLYEFEEWSMPQVAASVGCPLQTAYSRYRAARELIERAVLNNLRPGDRP